MEPTTSLQSADFRSLIDRLDDAAIWIVTEPGRFQYVSEGAEAIWGVPAETLQRDPERVLEGIHPEDRDRVRDGMKRPPETVDEETYEARVVRPNGSIRWVRTRQIPVRDDDGTLTNVVGISVDVTDRKRRELELEALNRVVRHDIRNDMSVMVGWAELLEDHVDEEGRAYLQRLQAAATHVLDQTEVARDFAHSVIDEGHVDLEPVSLKATLEHELALRRELHPEATFHVADDVPDVAVAANEMLGAVFRNLLANAVQHSDTPAPVVDVGVTLRADEAVVRIADDGPGIPDELRETLFEAGARGADSAGTGTGLHLVVTLVDLYGGTIELVESSAAGTTFEVVLPLADDPQ